MKKGVRLFLGLGLFLIFGLIFVGAQDDLSEISEDEIDEEFGDGGSINGFDRFFDGIFNNDLENMRERFAEIRTLINNGEIEEAKKLLEYYNDVANNLENEVSPEQRDEAVRLSNLIKVAVRDLEDKIPEEEKGEFGLIEERAEGVSAAAEIASKIKELCNELHKLGAWEEFEKVCNTEEGGPRWQQDLFDDLSDEQRREAEGFFEIMIECMESSGRECRCNEVPSDGFALKCAEIAPLAVLCEEGDEGACEEMDEVSEDIEDLLPPHLRDVLEKVENRFEDFGVPFECREQGITGNGRGDREKCEEIMFRENAPSECVEAGLTDHRECGKLMFELNAPQECLDAGLTGEEGDDRRKCEKIMRELGFGKEGSIEQNRGPDCRRIENAKERLECYDGASQNFNRDFENRGPPGGWPRPCVEQNTLTRETCEETMSAWGEQTREDHRANEAACSEQCREENAAWTMRNGFCECFDSRQSEFKEDFRKFRDFEERRENDFDEFRDFDPEEFSEEEKRKFEEEFGGEFNEDFRDFDEEEFNREEFNNRDEFSEDFDSGKFDERDFEESDSSGSSSGGDEDSSRESSEGRGEGDSGSGEGSRGSDGEESSSEESSSDVTGGVVSSVSGRGFLDYFFR